LTRFPSLAEFQVLCFSPVFAATVIRF
jgi:hypothetical protein